MILFATDWSGEPEQGRAGQNTLYHGFRPQRIHPAGYRIVRSGPNVWHGRTMQSPQCHGYMAQLLRLRRTFSGVSILGAGAQRVVTKCENRPSDRISLAPESLRTCAQLSASP